MTSNTNHQISASSVSTKLDEMKAGGHLGNLMVVAACPETEKSAFTLSMALNLAVNNGCGVLYFSLAESAQDVVRRMIIYECKLTAQKLKNRNITKSEREQIDVKLEKLIKAPIFIDDTRNISVFGFHDKCKRFVQQHGVSVIIINYLQLMTWNDDANVKIGQPKLWNMTQMLKTIARELNISITAFTPSQSGEVGKYLCTIIFNF